MPPEQAEPRPTQSAAGTIAAGILASRVLGFVRESVTAFFFGVSAYSDVLRAALRMPNVLQNLLGEGTISAAFIPVYSRLLDQGRAEEAGRFAGAIFALLLVVTSAVVLLAVALAEPLVALLVPGFTEDAARIAAGDPELPVDRYALSVRAVRIIFPMTGILVLSAWALGVLNSHRRFFLPYIAPVLWNAAIMAGMFGAALWIVGAAGVLEAPDAMTVDGKVDVLFGAFFGALVGGLLQFGVQLPLVFRVMRGFRPVLSTKVAGVREALAATGPALAGRGAAQFSSYIDQLLSSLLAAGALAALGYAQVLYLLPVSLFGASVAASELPELSRLSEADRGVFTARLDRSMRQIAFLTVPSLVGYLCFGLPIVMAIFGRGQFGVLDGWLVYAVLGAYSLGLLATTFSRLMQNSFWALGDTKTPAKVAVIRIVFSAAASLPLMFWFDRFAVHAVLNLPPPAAGNSTLYFGALGIATGATLGALVEIVLLHRALMQRIPGFHLPVAPLGRMAGLALAAAVPAALLWLVLPDLPDVLLAAALVGAFAAAYLAAAHLTGMPEMETWTGRFLKR